MNAFGINQMQRHPTSGGETKTHVLAQVLFLIKRTSRINLVDTLECLDKDQRNSERIVRVIESVEKSAIRESENENLE